jgi:hypothetical protein
LQKDVCYPLICVKELFEASKSMVAATFINRMLRAYPDVTLNHLEDLMSLRDDVKSKEVGLGLTRVCVRAVLFLQHFNMPCLVF